jgi:hypothetical protein
MKTLLDNYELRITNYESNDSESIDCFVPRNDRANIVIANEMKQTNNFQFSIFN